jgi:ribonuclease E
VLMVPNKTLETPNYRLERLKHDDPRLDNVQASYHMAEDIEDPTTVTRRSQERANKQEPVIKGVLPDAPAPIAVPRPEPVKPAEPVAKAPVQAPVAPPIAAPAAAETGFMGWFKGLFGSPAPMPAPAAAPVAEPKKEEKREGRGGRDGEPRREGRDGERGGTRRGEGRGDGRGGARRGSRDGDQRRGDNREGRETVRAAEGGEGQARPGEGRGRDGEQRRDGRGERTEGNREPREPREQREARDNREPREPKEPRADRGEGRGPRRDGENRMPAEPTDIGIPGTPSQAGLEAEQGQRPDRGPRGEGGRRERGERGGEGRRERSERGPRADRGPRDDGGQMPRAQVESMPGAVGADGASSEPAGRQQPSFDPMAEAPRPGDGQRPMADGEEPRRGRSRGRDRGERGDRPARDEANGAQPVSDSGVPAVAAQEPVAEPATERQRYATGFASQDGTAPGTAREAMPKRADAVEAPVARAEPAMREQPPAARAQQAPREQQAPRAEARPSEPVAIGGLPQVGRFELPVGELAQVAQGSGLQWVNSDADKIAAAQAAIAAEPKPIHMPRERAAAVVVQEGPLVLVETKRDLREVKLPFEQGGGAAPLQ